MSLLISPVLFVDLAVGTFMAVFFSRLFARE